MLARRDQIDRDQQQSDACNVSSQPRPASDDHQAEDHFYDPNDQHKRMADTSKDALCRRAQVLIPVHKQVKELIQACQEGTKKEGNSQGPPGGCQFVAHFKVREQILPTPHSDAPFGLCVETPKCMELNWTSVS